MKIKFKIVIRLACLLHEHWRAPFISTPKPAGRTLRITRAMFGLAVVGLVFCFFIAFSQARDVTITILHTTDIHGHITGLSLDGKKGGLLRCSTIIRRIREQEPNVLLIDIGDLIQGTAVSFFSKGNVMMDAVRILHYDALIPGNHEFDWGTANLRNLYRRAGIPVLIANCSSSNPDGFVFSGSQPFMIWKLDGVCVAIVGLTTPNIPHWSRPFLLEDLRFEQSVSALRRIMPYVRNKKPDVLVLAVHQGYRKWGDNSANEINSIARSFPEFDVILGGHTHKTFVRRELNRVTYTQAGCYGLWLGKVQLIVDTNRHCVKNKTVELLPVDDSVSPDRELKSRLAKPLSKAETYLNKTIGWSGHKHLAESCFPGQSQIQMLIARAIADAVDADVVFHGVFTDKVLNRGPITMRDVWWIVPYENYIGIAHLTLPELQTILEENSKYLETRNFRGVYGITYDLYPDKAPGSRVRNIRFINNRRIQNHARVKVAINSYDMASGGNRFPRLRDIIDQPLSRLERTGVTTKDAVVKYIKKHNPLNEQAVMGARLLQK